ncbi:MAG TPA: VTT domain-containing protein [Rhodanobacteraceae bacterium]|nr:VTT domain-containing protein [Rhodanobacteraceae bacterium]
MPHHELIPPSARPSLRRRIARHAITVAVVAAIAAVWVFSPLREWLDITRLVEVLRGLGDNALMPLVMMAVFVLGGAVLFPVNVMTAACMVIFGPWLGTVYAVLGGVLEAWAYYELGRHTGSGLRMRLTSGRMGRLRAALGRHGILAITVLRIVPVAPFTIVNLAAGAMHIDRRDYLVGTTLGMTPGAVLYAFLVDRAIAAINHPHWTNYLWLGIAGAVFAGGSIWLGRRMLIASRVQD